MADIQWNGAERAMAVYNEEKWDKVFEVIYDVRDRVTRIEEKQDVMNKRAEKVEEISMEADRKATEALILSRDNQKDINEVKANMQRESDRNRSNARWAWGFVISLGSSLVYLLLTKVLHVA